MKSVPKEFSEIISETAKRFSNSFAKLGYLSKEAMPESNTVIHLSSVLIDNGYAIYSEPIFEDNTQNRIDLLAYNENHTLLFEFKSFGEVNFSGLKKDAERLLKFRPFFPKLKNNHKFHFREQDKKDPWGIILLQCNRSKIPERWGNQHSEGICEGENEFYEFLNKYEAVYEKTEVDNKKDYWEDSTASLHLLWAVFKIPPDASAGC